MPLTTAHYVVTVETTGRLPEKDLPGWLDHWMAELEPWHPAIIGRGPNVTVTITLPADGLAQAVATALVIVGRIGEPVAVEALTEAERDARQGWEPVPELLSVTEAAQELGVSRQRVLQMVNERKLPRIQVGESLVLPQAAVEAVVARQRRAAVVEMPQAHSEPFPETAG